MRKRSQAEARPSPAKASKHGLWAAVWLDNYDEDYGIYAVFNDRDRCLDYLVDMVFFRAENLGVPVVDATADPCLAYGRKIGYPKADRKRVREILATEHDFEIPLKLDDTFCEVIDKVTVGIRETEEK